MLRYVLAVGLLVFLFGFSACGSGEDPDMDGLIEGQGSGDEVSSSSLKLYTLPSPLQVATAVRLFNVEYKESLLKPTSTSSGNFSTNFDRALNLGIYSIDMGYATLYEQNQMSVHYLSMIEKLSRELDIVHGFKPSTVKRFETNFNNQDSLYRIILTTFSSTHKYLQENHREDAGLLIIAGSFIEGLYLSSKLTKLRKDVQLRNLIGQQKIYLANIIELLDTYKEQPEIANLNAELSELSLLYKDVEVIYHESNILKGNVKMTDEQLDAISAKIADIRNDIVG